MSDRERILEQSLKHELRGVSVPSRPGCIDAETLAAWEDDSLDASTVASIEAHVSACTRCQALVAVSLRGTSAPSTLPGTEAPRPHGTLAWWKWLIPLAAGAAAVTLWMVVPEQQEIAVALPQPAASKQEAPPVAEVRPPEPPPAATPVGTQARDNNQVEARRSAAKAERADVARQDAAASAEAPARKEQAPAEAVMVQSSPAPPATPPSAPAPAAPPAPAAAPAIAGLRASAQFAAVLFEIVSPDSKQRWRVSAAGVERSLDIGGTWSLVRAADGEMMTAGTSPAPDVCWLIGNNGMVLLTTNGSVFTRVDVAGGGNLRTITAVDARSATIVNASGRAFRTDDGGRTWR